MKTGEILGTSNFTKYVCDDGGTKYTKTFLYDELHQLTYADDEQLSKTFLYLYDTVGNRTRFSDDNGSSWTNSYYDAANRLTRVRDDSYAYDSNGNLTLIDTAGTDTEY